MLARVLGGRFEILSLAGRGGMGEVFRARDHDGGAVVALKLLARRHVGETHLCAHFATEAEVLRALRVVGVPGHVAGGRLDGRPFLAMRWLDGRRLSDRVRAVPALQIGEAGAIVDAVLGVLDEVHAQGWVHGDLAPANVLVAPRGSVGLIDFGLARRIDGPTWCGEVCGTPPYMAPERGLGAPPSVASDLYAVGVMLHELLTGAPAFGAQPAEPARGAPLDEVVWSALRSEPGDRHPSALDMRRALRRALVRCDRTQVVARRLHDPGTSLAVTVPERVHRT